MVRVAEDRLPPRIERALLSIYSGGKGLTQQEWDSASELSGRELYNMPVLHTLNKYPVHRILDYALGDVEFDWAAALTDGFDYSVREACRNLLVDGFLFEAVDEYGIWWLEHVVEYDYFAKQLRFVKQQYPPDPDNGNLIEVCEWERPESLVASQQQEGDANETQVFEAKGPLIDACVFRRYWLRTEGDTQRRDEKAWAIAPWPLVDSLLGDNGRPYLNPVRYLLVRLDKIRRNIASNNDKHAKDRLFIMGNVQNQDELQRVVDLAAYDSAIVLPRDTKAEYPEVHDNGAMNQYEMETVEREINGMLNLVDVAAVAMSGISRRLAMQPMNALAMRLRGTMEFHIERMGELVKSDYELSFGSLESLDSTEKEIELRMLAEYRQVIGEEAFRNEVMRILEIAN